MFTRQGSFQTGFAQHRTKGRVLVRLNEIVEAQPAGLIGREFAGRLFETLLLLLAFGRQRGKPLGPGLEGDNAAGDDNEAAAASGMMIVDARNWRIGIPLGIPDDMAVLVDAAQAGA